MVQPDLVRDHARQEAYRRNYDKDPQPTTKQERRERLRLVGKAATRAGLSE